MRELGETVGADEMTGVEALELVKHGLERMDERTRLLHTFGFIRT